MVFWRGFSKKLVGFLVMLVVLILWAGLAEARQGRCSHHGGVCGCGFCDGSFLSEKCAPYYPHCKRP